MVYYETVVAQDAFVLEHVRLLGLWEKAVPNLVVLEYAVRVLSLANGPLRIL